MTAPAHLANWSGTQVVQECRTAYNAYRAAKTQTPSIGTVIDSNG